MDQELKLRTDMELMCSYQRGDEAAFLELFERYQLRVFSYLQKRIKSDMVNDLYQDIFLKLHEKKHLYDVSYPFAPWFFTLIRHSTIDFFRRKKLSWEQLPHQDSLADRSAETSSMTIDFDSFGLNNKDQSLLFQKFVEGKGYKELAQEFSAKEQNLRKKVSRLLKQIRQGGPL